MNPNLKSIQAIGSDGDEALQNAIEICFKDSIKLLCAGHKRENIERHGHKRENIERHLKSLKAATSSINHIIADIFGRERQSEKGLIDSMSADSLIAQTQSFKLLLMLSILLLLKLVQRRAWVVTSAIKCRLNKSAW
jgi:hypothetical protein